MRKAYFVSFVAVAFFLSDYFRVRGLPWVLVHDCFFEQFLKLLVSFSMQVSHALLFFDFVLQYFSLIEDFLVSRAYC